MNSLILSIVSIPTKPCGYDNISSYFLRLGAEIFAPILSVYFELALELGIFSQIFKTAKVIPIHKSGNKQLVQNYGSIFLLSCLSKILEKVIKNRLLTFFSKHKIIYDYQYAFREKHSVIHALLDVLSFNYDAIQKKTSLTLLLVDLKKAFDTVSHEVLLKKLYHYGIRGPAYDLIESFFSN